MARIFIVDEREHPDPDSTRTIEQVRDMMADFFPDLASVTHTVTARGEDQVIEFRRTVGTKGSAKDGPPPVRKGYDLALPYSGKRIRVGGRGEDPRTVHLRQSRYTRR